MILALPEMERSLHVPLSGITWVIIGYLLVITLLATQVGRLGDMLGRVRMYEAGFLIFIIGSAVCAVAAGEGTIIGFRVIQGIGGALITANSGAVIADTFPSEMRGRAYGYISIGWSTGAIVGILLGGLIREGPGSASWAGAGGRCRWSVSGAGAGGRRRWPASRCVRMLPWGPGFAQQPRRESGGQCAG